MLAVAHVPSEGVPAEGGSGLSILLCADPHAAPPHAPHAPHARRGAPAPLVAPQPHVAREAQLVQRVAAFGVEDIGALSADGRALLTAAVRWSLGRWPQGTHLQPARGASADAPWPQAHVPELLELFARQVSCHNRSF